VSTGQATLKLRAFRPSRLLALQMSCRVACEKGWAKEKGMLIELGGVRLIEGSTKQVKADGCQSQKAMRLCESTTTT